MDGRDARSRAVNTNQGTSRWWLRSSVAITMSAGLIAAGDLTAAAAPSGPPVDVNLCGFPPGEQGAYTTGWMEREAWNVYCSMQGNQDRNTNPAYWQAEAEMVADRRHARGRSGLRRSALTPDSRWRPTIRQVASGIAGVDALCGEGAPGQLVAAPVRASTT